MAESKFLREFKSEMSRIYQFWTSPSTWCWVFGFFLIIGLFAFFFHLTSRFDILLRMLNVGRSCAMDLNNKQAGSLVVFTFTCLFSMLMSIGEIINAVENRKRGIPVSRSLYWTLGISISIVIGMFVLLRTFPCF
ncbi:MAG TPA: hypothetical protein VIY47_00300 [Ignavibacteriaceae bacterium]